MTVIDQPGPNLSLADVAAGVAHAMNNLLASLYGAASYLEAAAQTPGIARASTAIGSATATGQALSAALYLLSLTEADMNAIASKEVGRHLLDDAEQERLFEALTESANVDCAKPSVGIKPKVHLDPDTLKALLICAAFNMRREAGPREVIRCTVRVEQGTVSDHAALVFELDAPSMAARTISAPVSVRAEHPCAIAMAYFGAILPVECASLQRDSAAVTRLRLPLIP